MDMEFDEFRDEMDEAYRLMNKEMSIRIAPPSDTAKFHMLVAIDTYMRLLVDPDYYDDDMNVDPDTDWDDFFKR